MKKMTLCCHLKKISFFLKFWLIVKIPVVNVTFAISYFPSYYFKFLGDEKDDALLSSKKRFLFFLNFV